MTALRRQLLVKVAGFGSVWRSHRAPTVSHQYVLNTTGFKKQWRHIEVAERTSKEIKQRELKGFVRLNCNREDPITAFEREIGKVFLSPGVERFGKENRLLLHPPIAIYDHVDAYLVS